MKNRLLAGMLIMVIGTNLSAQSIKINKESCDNGNPMGCTELGHMYASGEGVEQDLLKASVHYRRACESGDSRGCFYLGYMYANNKNINQNFLTADEFHIETCDSSNPKSYFDLGYMYANTDTVFSNHLQKISCK